MPIQRTVTNPRMHHRKRLGLLGCFFAFALQAADTVPSSFPRTQSTTDLPPLEIRLSGVSTGGVSLSWTAIPGAAGYRVESREGWGSGDWISIPPEQQWPVAETAWTDLRPVVVGGRFYRVVALEAPVLVRGRVISSEPFRTNSLAEVTSLFKLLGLPLQPQNGIVAHRVLYATVDAHGLATTASGLLVLPLGVNKALPLASYQHGTLILRNEAPSLNEGGEFVVGLALGAAGYATALPDYVGLGQSPGLHPFMHARSAATVVVDFLRAARTVCTNQALALNGQVFLVGYSQGGQVTMAAHREIEAFHTNEFQITASAPMAGPYDLSGTMVSVMLSDKPYDTPYYLPYTLLAYNEVYRLYPSASDFLAAPYDSKLPPLFDGAHSDAQISAVMPAIPSQILRPEYLQDFRQNPNHPMRLALQDNDLYHWRPRALMHLYHCHGDTTVPYANSEVAFQSFRQQGASQVELIDPFPSADHGTGALYCLLAAQQWFETLRK